MLQQIAVIISENGKEVNPPFLFLFFFFLLFLFGLTNDKENSLSYNFAPKLLIASRKSQGVVFLITSLTKTPLRARSPFCPLLLDPCPLQKPDMPPLTRIRLAQW
jgi:hypothetical protein